MAGNYHPAVLSFHIRYPFDVRNGSPWMAKCRNGQLPVHRSGFFPLLGRQIFQCRALHIRMFGISGYNRLRNSDQRFSISFSKSVYPHVHGLLCLLQHRLPGRRPIQRHLAGLALDISRSSRRSFSRLLAASICWSTRRAASFSSASSPGSCRNDCDRAPLHRQSIPASGSPATWYGVAMSAPRRTKNESADFASLPPSICRRHAPSV